MIALYLQMSFLQIKCYFFFSKYFSQHSSEQKRRISSSSPLRSMKSSCSALRHLRHLMFWPLPEAPSRKPSSAPDISPSSTAASLPSSEYRSSLSSTESSAYSSSSGMDITYFKFLGVV